MSENEFTGAAFYANLANHKLVGTRCKECGAVHLPPRGICPACHSSQVEWFEFSGRGKLAAYTVIYAGSTAMIQAGYDRKNPYCSGFVELEEGPRISAQILGVDVAKPESIEIGTPLTVAFVERGEGDKKKTYLGFQA